MNESVTHNVHYDHCWLRHDDSPANTRNRYYKLLQTYYVLVEISTQTKFFYFNFSLSKSQEISRQVTRFIIPTLWMEVLQLQAILKYFNGQKYNTVAFILLRVPLMKGKCRRSLLFTNKKRYTTNMMCSVMSILQKRGKMLSAVRQCEPRVFNNNAFRLSRCIVPTSTIGIKILLFV